MAQTITSNLRVVVASLPANICTDTSASLKFKVENKGKITPSEEPRVEVWAVPITSANTCASGVDQGVKAAEVALNWTNGNEEFSPKDVNLEYSVTVQSLNFCNQVASKPNWALCAYAWPADSRTTFKPIAGPPASIYGALSGGTTAETAPVIKDVVAGDGQISFTATNNKNATLFELCYVELESPLNDEARNARIKEITEAETCSGGNLKSREVTGPSVVVDKLANGTEYYFIVGPAGEKLWSKVQKATPEKGHSTLEVYDGPAGGVSWQCAQTNSGLDTSFVLALFGFLGLAFGLSPRRRSQFRRGLSVLGVCVFLALPAQADFGQLNLGIFGGPYKPNLDANATFKTYKCMYNDAVLPMLGAELDLHLGDPFGSFQFGLATGYSWATGKALSSFDSANTNCQPLSNIPVALHMLHIRPRLSYVFDYFVEDFPFVPFMRAGLIGGGYYFTYQGRADTRGQDKGTYPIGLRFGWEASAGLMFLMDVLEPSVAARAQGAGTYDHLYLKAEVTYQSINDFGPPGMDFSPTSTVGEPANYLGTIALVFQFQ